MKPSLFKQPGKDSAVRLKVDRHLPLAEQLTRLGLSAASLPLWTRTGQVNHIPLHTRPSEGVFYPLTLAEMHNGLVIMAELRDHPRFRAADLTELLAFLQQNKSPLPAQQEILAFGSITPDEKGVMRAPCVTTSENAKGLRLEFRKVADIFGATTQPNFLVWQKT